MPRIVQLVVLVCLAASPATAEPPLPDGAERRLAPSLAEGWKNGADSFRVVVHLEAPPEARLPLSPRGAEQPRPRLAAVRSTTTQAVGEVMERAAAEDLEVIQVSRLRPTFSARVSRAGLERILESPQVRFVQEDEVWHTHTLQGRALIRADALYDLGFSGAGGSVAVIDTGVDYTHPALGGGPIPNGKVVYGRDTVANSNDPMDCDGHGTAVAAIAAGAVWPFLTYAGGVAPGASILAYKASADRNCGSFFTSDVVEAIDDAILLRDTHAVVAINLSIGGDATEGPCDRSDLAYAAAIGDAVEAGITVVASSGNEALKTMIATPACVSSALSVASVYDDDSVTDRGISYCANDDCSEILCTDSQLPAGSPTCYSNTSAYLDLFAPAESARTAAPGSTSTPFGGTSAAAPYVAGAVALLLEAVPGLTPEQLRLLLGIAGEPVTDAGNGVTRPLVDLDAAHRRGRDGIGVEGRLPIPDSSGVPVVSTAVVATSGEVRSVRVMVKIAHGNPPQLEVSLTAPDGTVVRLHDRGPGTTANPDGVNRVDSLFVTYPDDRAPAESLDAFRGRPAQGIWTLTVVDRSPALSGGPGPALLGWAVDVDTGGAPEVAFLIPVAIHAAGAAGTFWVTDVRLLNPSGEPADVELYLVPAGLDGTTGGLEAGVRVGAESVLDLADLVAGSFGADDLQGNLLVGGAAAELVATSRTYTNGAVGGTYGQFIGASEPSAAVGAGDAGLVLLQLADNAGYRANIGFSEAVGAEAAVRVTLHDGGTGAVLGTPEELTVEPFSNTQVNGVFAELGAGASDNAYATVEVVGGGGRVVAYASVVDNLTGDAIAVPGRRPQTVSEVVVPIVARTAGQAGTDWVSDLRVLNGGTTDLSLTLEYRPEQGSAGGPASTGVTLGPAAVLAVDDLLAEAFDVTSGSGSLRVAVGGEPAPLLVTSRTYNQTDLGTYGQFVGGVTGGLDGTAYLAHLDSSDDFRTNVGFCEVSGGSVLLLYTLRAGDGEVLGSRTVSLGPYEVLQVNDVFEAVGAAPATNAWLEVARVNGAGTYAVYASVVDNHSGDAIFIPGTSAPE